MTVLKIRKPRNTTTAKKKSDRVTKTVLTLKSKLPVMVIGMRKLLKIEGKLLNFMEKRWDLKFENEAAKLELLFLTFMTEDAE